MYHRHCIISQLHPYLSIRHYMERLCFDGYVQYKYNMCMYLRFISFWNVVTQDQIYNCGINLRLYKTPKAHLISNSFHFIPIKSEYVKDEILLYCPSSTGLSITIFSNPQKYHIHVLVYINSKKIPEV